MSETSTNQKGGTWPYHTCYYCGNRYDAAIGIGINCPKCGAGDYIVPMYKGEGKEPPWQSGAERLHEWWELSYASYLVLPRSLLQSMPDKWQGALCDLLEVAREISRKHGVVWPPDDVECAVNLRDKNGKYVHDNLADYERGRRKLWENGK